MPRPVTRHMCRPSPTIGQTERMRSRLPMPIGPTFPRGKTSPATSPAHAAGGQDNVSGNRPREPRVLVLKLRQRTSERGNIYLDGWMGQAKLLGFKEAERDEYGNEVWSIYAVTPTSKGDRT
jgi:hypothetical protein